MSSKNKYDTHSETKTKHDEHSGRKPHIYYCSARDSGMNSDFSNDHHDNISPYWRKDLLIFHHANHSFREALDYSTYSLANIGPLWWRSRYKHG